MKPDEFDDVPRAGTIARCSNGNMGLILSTYHSQAGDTIYKGIQLSPDMLGQPWQSVSPKILGHVRYLTGGTFAYIKKRTELSNK